MKHIRTYISLIICLAVFIHYNVVSIVICSAQGANHSDSSHDELTLDRVVDIALNNNRSIIDQELTEVERSINLNSAYDVFDIKINPLSSINYTTGSENDITVWEVGGAISKRFQTGVDVVLRPSIARGDDEYDASVGFAIAVPLLRGLGEQVVKDTIYINEFAQATSVRNVHRQKVSIMLETISTVYSSVREKQLINLYREQIENLRNHLKHVRIKEKVGLARSMDVYRVEIRIKEVEDSLSLSQESADNTIDTLKNLLAFPMSDPLRVTAPLHYSIIDLGLEQASNVALSERVEIRQGEADVSESVRREQVAKLTIKPELNLEASYTRRGRAGEFENSFIFDEDVFRIGFRSDTDFARSVEKANWEQSRITVNRARLQQKTVQDNVIQEVRRVLNSLEKSEQRIRLRREQIVQAQGKQRLAYVKFQHGEADNFDLVESQVQLQRAQVNLVSDEIQYIVGGYQLRAAMGTLLAYRGN